VGVLRAWRWRLPIEIQNAEPLPATRSLYALTRRGVRRNPPSHLSTRSVQRQLRLRVTVRTKAGCFQRSTRGKTYGSTLHYLPCLKNPECQRVLGNQPASSTGLSTASESLCSFPDAVIPVVFCLRSRATPPT